MKEVACAACVFAPVTGGKIWGGRGFSSHRLIQWRVPVISSHVLSGFGSEGR